MAEERDARFLQTRQTATGSYIAQAVGGSTAIVAVYANTAPPSEDQAVLTAGKQKLAELPLEALPPPGSLPSWSRMPFRPNPLFVGREMDLHRMATVLKAQEGAVVAVTALGGMGKTQLASEFVHRYGQYFAGGIFWLNCTNAQTILTEVADCHTALRQDLPIDVTALPLEEQARLVRVAWQSPLPRLLIFNDCEDDTLFAQWRPSTGGCRVIITSRREQWNAELGVTVHPLRQLRLDESRRLLRQQRPDLSDAELDAIAHELGNLPLALYMAGYYLHEYRNSSLGRPKVYLRQICSVNPLEHPSLQGEGTSPATGHELHVKRTFAVSYERLDRTNTIDAYALRVLARAAHLAPEEPISLDLLAVTMEEAAHNAAAEEWVVQAVKRLSTLGLLETLEQGAVRLHRLLVAFARQQAESNGSEARVAVEQTLLSIVNASNEASYPAPMLALQRHLRAVTDLAIHREDEMAIALCEVLGHHLYLIGAFGEAETYFKQTLHLREQVLGPEHPKVASDMNNLASLYRARGKYEQAESLYQHALRICEYVWGPEHPDVAGCLNNLANLYNIQGKYEKAEPLYLRALRICEQVLGVSHHDVATSLNNLANLYNIQGKYEEVAPLYLRALQINEKELGSEHPEVAAGLSNLANLYAGQGKYEEAEKLGLRALRIREQVLGSEHPDVAASLRNLADLYTEQGKYEEAEPLLRRALHINEQVLGPEHPDVAGNLNSLACLYVYRDKYEEAERLLRRALRINEQALGPEYRSVAGDLNGLGIIYTHQGKYEEAELLYQRASHIYEQILGPKHPEVAASLHNLADFYIDQGKYEEAEPLLQRALQINEQALGPGYSVIAQNLNSLGTIYAEQGKYEEAEPLWQRALQIREQVLGVNHHDVAQSLNNLANLYTRQDKHEKAESLWQRALHINEQMLGPEHSIVAQNLEGLGILYARQGKREEAEPLLLRALRINEHVFGPEHSIVAASLRNLADLYVVQGKYEEAGLLYLRALRISEQVLGPGHLEVADSLNTLVALYYTQGKYEEAEPLCQRALTIYQLSLGLDHPLTKQAIQNIDLLRDRAHRREKRANHLFKRIIHPFITRHL